MKAAHAYMVGRLSGRERVLRKLPKPLPGLCPSCWHATYRVGPYLICRNLRCERLVAE